MRKTAYLTRRFYSVNRLLWCMKITPYKRQLICTVIAVLIVTRQAPSYVTTDRHRHDDDDSATFSYQPCSRHEKNNNNTKVVVEWKQKWMGDEFYKYKRYIDHKIKAYRKNKYQIPRKNRHTTTPSQNSYEMPLYAGEFGYELAGIIPWAYSLSTTHNLTTHGRPGTKYLYYFSQKHSIQSTKNKGEPQRKSHRLPKESPFGESPHFGIDQFPKQGWVPPPYKEFFNRKDEEDIQRLLAEKPLLFMSNKYTMEWRHGPINHIPLRTLREILSFLTPHYHIVYNRFEDARLVDKLESKINAPPSSTTTKNGDNDGVVMMASPYEDKEMIRSSFPTVVFLEELTKSLEPDDVNLLLLSLGSVTDTFISVQGGNSVVNSFFGGTNIIYCVRGPETNYTSETGGDFTYYHKFSNATIVVAENEFDFCNAVKDQTIQDNYDTTTSDGCQYCTKQK